MSTPLPAAYAWLGKEPGPRMIVQGRQIYGTIEGGGAADNPLILAWAKECGIAGYGHDSIAWCGLFVAICAHRAGKPIVKGPLAARSWQKFGVRAKTPMLGDVLVFSRPPNPAQGHVGLYVGEDTTAYHVLGGNQGNRVSIARVAKARLLQARRPLYAQQPANVRVIRLRAAGALSTNEG